MYVLRPSCALRRRLHCKGYWNVNRGTRENVAKEVAKLLFGNLIQFFHTQESCLLFYDLITVLDFIDAACVRVFIVDHHVVFAANIKLEFAFWHL